MRLHLFYSDKNWKKHGACANNYDLIGETKNNTYEIFENFLEQLRSHTFEEILEEDKKGKDENSVLVECTENQVYNDEDLYEFLEELGAEVIDYNCGYALIKTDKDKYYEVPYTDFENRFGDDLPNETMLFFDINRIYDVTDRWADA